MQVQNKAPQAASFSKVVPVASGSFKQGFPDFLDTWPQMDIMNFLQPQAWSYHLGLQEHLNILLW